MPIMCFLVTCTIVTTATLARELNSTVMQPIGLFVIFMGRAVTYFCCNLLLWTLECYPMCSHALRLLCF